MCRFSLPQSQAWVRGTEGSGARIGGVPEGARGKRRRECGGSRGWASSRGAGGQVGAPEGDAGGVSELHQVPHLQRPSERYRGRVGRGARRFVQPPGLGREQSARVRPGRLAGSRAPPSCSPPTPPPPPPPWRSAEGGAGCRVVTVSRPWPASWRREMPAAAHPATLYVKWAHRKPPS